MENKTKQNTVIMSLFLWTRKNSSNWHHLVWNSQVGMVSMEWLWALTWTGEEVGGWAHIDWKGILQKKRDHLAGASPFCSHYITQQNFSFLL